MWVHGMMLSIFVFISELATHGTWTTVSWINRVIRWGIALFKSKRIESELRLFEKVHERSAPTPTTAAGRRRTRKTKTKRRLVEGVQHFVWADLTNSDRGGVIDPSQPAKPGIKIKKTEKKL